MPELSSEIISISSGGATAQLGGGALSSSYTTVGVKSFDLVSGGGSNLRFAPSPSTTDIVIDNVSLKEIL